MSSCGPETIQLLTCYPDAQQSPSLPLGFPLVAPGLGAWAQLGGSRLLGGSCKQETKQDHAQPFLLSLYSSFHTHPCLCSSTLTPTLYLSPLIPAYSPLLHSPLPCVTLHSPCPSALHTHPYLLTSQCPLTPALKSSRLFPHHSPRPKHSCLFPLPSLPVSFLLLKLSPCPSWEEVRRQGWGARGQKVPGA